MIVFSSIKLYFRFRYDPRIYCIDLELKSISIPILKYFQNGIDFRYYFQFELNSVCKRSNINLKTYSMYISDNYAYTLDRIYVTDK